MDSHTKAIPKPSYRVGTYLEVTPDLVLFTFGKHKGTDIVDVPADYLRWALHEILDAPEEFHELIRAELHRRQHEGVGVFDFEEE